MSDQTAPVQALEVAPAETAPINLAPQAQAAAEPVEITPENLREIPAAQRDALLFGEAPAEATATEPTATEPAAPEPTTPVATEPEKLLPNRISTAQFDAREQEAIALKHELKQSGEDITLSEACRRVDAKYAGPQAADPAPTIPGTDPDPEAAPAAPPPGSIEALQAEAEALAEAMAAHDDELVGPEFRKLQAQHAGKLAEIAAAKSIAQLRQEGETANRRAAREQSKAAVLADYPTAASDDTLLGAEIALQYLALQEKPANDPDRARFAQDDGPKWLTDRAVAAVQARIVKSMGLTPEQALGFIKGTPPNQVIAEAKGPAAMTAPRTAVPRNLAVAAPGNRPAADPVAVDPKQLLEKARTDPRTREAILGFGGEVLVG